MNEIKCPHCGKVFQVDESGYAQLLRQVRDAEFERDMNEREKLMETAHAQAVAAAEARLQAENQKALAQRDQELSLLRQQLEAKEAEGALEVRSAVAEVARERDALQAQVNRQADMVALARADAERAAVDRAAKTTDELRERAAKEASELQARLAERDARIAALEQQLSAQSEKAEAERALAVTTATAKADLRVVELEGQVRQAESERAQVEAAMNARLTEQAAFKDQQLREKDDEIARLRDQRVRLTTKLVGESLEQHCEMEFNRWRATAFRNVEFHKDNEVVEGSKGDYIYREIDEDGVEILSIMFEMKTEEETTTHHHKNEDFFKKLDQDRQKKNCEYAVLVSMLEPESEYYNAGIVDVSYAYDKMYVIRPQLFVPMITILRNAAMNGVEARRELARVQQQNIDVTNFEAKLEAFKKGFGGNYERASKKFSDAIQQIDKAIADLRKVRDSLTSSENQLRLANEKADALTIRKLTWGNPTMKAAFDEARALRESEEAAESEGTEGEAEVVEPEIIEPGD